MKATKIYWEQILEKRIPNVEVDFGKSPIHYEKVMELSELGYKVPQSLIDYKDEEIQEDEDNPFFSNEFVRHVKEDFLVEVKLNIPKKYLEFAKQSNFNLSEMMNTIIAQKMQFQ